VEILGLDGTPDAGDQFAAVESEKRARELADFRQEKSRDSKLQRQQAAKLDNMFESMTAGEKKTLNLVVKADVRGSLEAIQSALLDLGNEEVQVNIVSGGVGGITETDVTLSMTSNARYAGTGIARGNRGYRRGARSVPLAKVRPDCRLYGDRGYCVPLQADPCTARQRGDLRG
jgi:translation initiation factor IF-2